MAQDNTIPLGKPGIASFESETYGNAAELRFGDTPAIVERNQTILADADIDWPLGTVVNVDPTTGVITQAVVAVGVSNATHITASPLVLLNTETMEAPMYEAGHFRMQALTFDATFNTDALKLNAFKGSDTPMIVISKAKFTDDNFPA